MSAEYLSEKLPLYFSIKSGKYFYKRMMDVSEIAIKDIGDIYRMYGFQTNEAFDHTVCNQMKRKKEKCDEGVVDSGRNDRIVPRHAGDRDDFKYAAVREQSHEMQGEPRAAPGRLHRLGQVEGFELGGFGHL
jgi:hypothetical protein